MKIFALYIIGAMLTGIIYELLYSNESFYNHRIELIHKVKSEQMLDNPMVNDIPDDDIINQDIFLAMIASFLGLISVIVSIIGWYADTKNN